MNTNHARTHARMVGSQNMGLYNTHRVPVT